MYLYIRLCWFTKHIDHRFVHRIRLWNAGVRVPRQSQSFVTGVFCLKYSRYLVACFCLIFVQWRRVIYVQSIRGDCNLKPFTKVKTAQKPGCRVWYKMLRCQYHPYTVISVYIKMSIQPLWTNFRAIRIQNTIIFIQETHLNILSANWDHFVQALAHFR